MLFSTLIGMFRVTEHEQNSHTSFEITHPRCFQLQIPFLEISYTQHKRQDKASNMFRMIKPSSGVSLRTLKGH